MSRIWALLQTEDGNFTKLSRRAAFEMVADGDFGILRRRPFTISHLQFKEFQEEQRHTSGRRIPGISKPLFNGKSSTSSGIRCRPPRSAVNLDYVRTAILLRSFQLAEEERRDEAVRAEDKKARRRRRRRRKK